MPGKTAHSLVPLLTICRVVEVGGDAVPRATAIREGQKPFLGGPTDTIKAWMKIAWDSVSVERVV